jgi:hypothetical protein
VSWNVYGNDGQRKYLTRSEIDLFLQCARSQDPATYSLCWMMAVTGCRISEALSLGEQSIDFEAKQVIILCLKKRQRRVFRAIPLPQDLLSSLSKWMRNGVLPRDKFWPWCRMTAYRRVCQIMREAGLTGGYATPKGLRHGFAIRAIQSNVPLTLVQRWLGHADIKTTAIYTSATGPEERELASRLWSAKARNSHSRSRSAPERSMRKAITARSQLPATAIEASHSSVQEMAPSRHFQEMTQAAVEASAHLTSQADGALTTFDQSGSDQFGAILSCCLLHYWLNCNSNTRYKSVTYG